jgi:dephospho-CoA kinase
MLIIGLTGSIGMGKSTAAKRFAELGVPVCDADAEVHALYAGAAVAPIEAAFPGTTVAGKVDRVALAAALMRDPSGFPRLEAIVHPLVFEAERQFLMRAEASGAAMAVIEVPLLFETGGDRRVDVTVVVSAAPEQQRQRVLERAGMTAEKLETILARQLPDAEKRRRADHVIDTSGSIEDSRGAVDRVVEALRGRPGTAYERYWKPGRPG